MMPHPQPTEVDTSLAFKYHHVLWKILGLQPPLRTSKWYKPYIVYAITFMASFSLLAISLYIYLPFSKTLLDLCETLCNIITSSMFIFKYLYIHKARQKILKMSNILKSLDVRAGSPLEVLVLRESTSSSRKLVKVFTFFSVLFIIACQIVTYFAKGRALAVPTWVPWDPTASQMKYLLAHFYETYSIACDVMIATTVDTYPPTCFIILSAQIKALAVRIEKLGSDSSTSEEALYKELSNCIKDHNHIYHLFTTIQEVVSTPCLIQFAASCLSQCTLGVCIIYAGLDLSKLIHISSLFIYLTMQIFCLCYFGDLYCQANEHLTESIYACNWMDRDIKFRKAFLLMLQRSQLTSTIRAGYLVPVQMTTFVQISKMAYSVFTVLNNTK